MKPTTGSQFSASSTPLEADLLGTCSKFLHRLGFLEKRSTVKYDGDSSSSEALCLDFSWRN